MKITKLKVNRREDAWEITFPEIGVEEFTAEENKLLKLLTGPVNYADILKRYSMCTDTIFYYINSMHKKFIIQRGKEAADNFLYMAMLKLCGATDERGKQPETLVVDKDILLYQ